MKQFQMISLICSVALFVGCESSQTAGTGNQEEKRLAAVRQQEQQPQQDESEKNLWNAHQDHLNKDGNPLRNY